MGLRPASSADPAGRGGKGPSHSHAANSGRRMRPYAELLTTFADLLATSRPGAAAPIFRHRGSDGLQIYRDSLLAGRIRALEDTYTVTCRLVGERCFEATAGAYIAVTRHCAWSLQRSAAGFPDFLSAFQALKSLPYLADVARLERACERAQTGRDPRPLDWARFAQAAEAGAGSPGSNLENRLLPRAPHSIDVTLRAPPAPG